MNDGKQPLRIPWGSLIVSALLFAGVYTFLDMVVLRNKPTATVNLVLAAVTFLVAFWVTKTVQNAFWGLVAASVLAFHPVLLQLISTNDDGQMLSVVVVELLALCCVLGIWHLSFQKSRRVVAMLGLMAVLIITGVCGWLLSPHAGWVTGFLAGSGFLLTAGFVALTGTANLSVRLAWCAGAVVVAGAVPVACLFLTAPTLRAADGLIDPPLGGWLQLPMADACTVNRVLSAAYQPQIADNPFPGFQFDELSRWTWPQMYVTLGLTGLAVWLCLRRGWLYCRTHRPPLPWAFLLFSLSVLVADSLHPQSVRDMQFIPLVTVAVLLSVFTIGDLVLSFGEAVRLQPPEDYSEPPTQMAKDT